MDSSGGGLENSRTTLRPLQYQVLPAAVATGRVPDGLEDTEAGMYLLGLGFRVQGIMGLGFDSEFRGWGGGGGLGV